MRRYTTQKVLSLMITMAFAGCGGGGGGKNPTNTAGSTSPETPGNNNGAINWPIPGPSPEAVKDNTTLSMTCVDGPSYQCSGRTILRVDNGIGLSSSGVQTYGKSTTDTATVIKDPSNPTGLDLATGGTVEMRIAKAPNGTASGPRLILSNLGISFDGTTERPTIVETFQNQQGRIIISDAGLVSMAALPPYSDTAFYDYASKATGATQVNYANNIYFPRTEPVRCPVGKTCRATETDGVTYTAGDWREGSANNRPDMTSATRLHEDGDIHAGTLQDGSVPGVPYPGSKGFRSFSNFSYQYGNLTNWETQDTVLISELGGGSAEHSQMRRGSIAYGQVTDSAGIPTTGTATYSGYAYGWYVSAKDNEPVNFYGLTKVTVNFLTRQAQVALSNAMSFDATATALPIGFTNFIQIGAAGSNVANYLTGAATIGTMSGGMSSRFFGPITNGSPAEMGGVFSTRSASAGTVVVGGFIVRKP